MIFEFLYVWKDCARGKLMRVIWSSRWVVGVKAMKSQNHLWVNFRYGIVQVHLLGLWNHNIGSLVHHIRRNLYKTYAAYVRAITLYASQWRTLTPANSGTNLFCFNHAIACTLCWNFEDGWSIDLTCSRKWASSGRHRQKTCNRD